MQQPTLDALNTAASTVYAHMSPTPQFSWPLLNKVLGVETWIKHENHTSLSNFKIRGGLVYMERLRERMPELRGVVAATRGNHGQAVAFAARKFNVRTKIFVPYGNSVEKNSAMQSLGAEVIEIGKEYQEARDHAEHVAVSEDLHLISNFHEHLVLGVASAWLELLGARPDLNLILVPIGQGSCICAAIAARNALKLKTRIVGVVSSNAPSYQLSFRAKDSIAAPVSNTIADGLACRKPDPSSLKFIFDNVENVVSVTDEQVKEAMRLYYRATHNLAEGAGAAALAAALQLRENGILKVEKLGLPLTGSNVDADVFSSILRN